MIYDDCDLEITALWTKQKLELAEEKDRVLKLKGDYGIIKKRMGQMQKEKDENDNRMRDMKEERKDLNSKIITLEKEKLLKVPFSNLENLENLENLKKRNF